MSKKLYEKWLADGPDAMAPKDVEAALCWRDGNPHEAYAAKREFDKHRVLEDRRAILMDTAIREGASPSDAARFAESTLTEERETAIKQADEQVRIAAARSVLRGF